MNDDLGVLSYIQNLKKGWNETKNRITKEIPEKMEKDYKEFAREAIELFYISYSPKYYSRNGKLVQGFKVKQRNDINHLGVSYGFTNEGIGYHRVDAQYPDYIVDVVLGQGWHGGPIWGITYEKDGEIMHTRRNKKGLIGQPAVQTSPSPVEYVEQKIAEKNGYQDELAEIINDYIDKYIL